jgi:hypothetical protein
MNPSRVVQLRCNSNMACGAIVVQLRCNLSSIRLRGVKGYGLKVYRGRP